MVVGQASAMPVWHNMLFMNTKLLSCYALALVRKGVVTLCDALCCDKLIVAPSWVGAYQQ